MNEDNPLDAAIEAINAFMASDAALPLNALAKRIGALGPAKPAEGAAEDEEIWGYAWSYIGSHENSSGILVGFDYAQYLESKEPAGDVVRAELSAWLRLNPSQQWGKAVERVHTALKQVFGDAALVSYPNSSPHRSGIPVVHGGTSQESLDRRVIYISWNSGEGLGLNQLSSNAINAVNELGSSVDKFIAAVDVALGAIYGEVPTLSLDTITGWCGEVAAWHQTAPSEFSRSWYAPYDLLTADGQTVEVKATRAKTGGTCIFSPQETAFALKSTFHRLICLRIPASTVSELYDELRKHKNAPQPTSAWKINAPTSRLIEATGITKGTAFAAKVAINAAVDSLKKALSEIVIADVDQPLAFLVPVATAAFAACLGVTVPFDRVDTKQVELKGPQPN